MTDLIFLAQSSSDGDAGGTIFLLCLLCIAGIVAVVSIASMWAIFEKAGRPGWAALIPIYNYIVLLEIVGRPLWWLLLGFIPFVSLIVGVLVSLDLAKSFGKSEGFGCGLILLPIIFLPMLAFGDAQYQGVPSR